METIKATSTTIACSLTRDELMDVGAAWEKLFRLSPVSRDLVPGGLRLVVDPGSEEALRSLIEIERECCRWVTFVLDGPSVTMTADGEHGQEAIRAKWVAIPV
jgi:hypothetical protein